MELELNAPLISLGYKDSATMQFAPDAGLLLVVQNLAPQFPATALYGLGTEILGEIQLLKSDEDLHCEALDGNSHAFNVSNASINPSSIVGASLFGMGEASEGYISVGDNPASIGQLQSLLIVTEPRNICLNFFSKNETPQTFYLFEPGKIPTPYTLKPASSTSQKADVKLGR